MGLKGDLGELSLPDLVEMTSVGSKTGRLILHDEEGAVAGVLSFRDGRLVGARAGELTAERAFYALLGLSTGSFDFDPAAQPDEDEVSLPTQSLLMEGMRRLDETRRLRRELPAPAVVAAPSRVAHDRGRGREQRRRAGGARARLSGSWRAPRGRCRGGTPRRW